MPDKQMGLFASPPPKPTLAGRLQTAKVFLEEGLINPAQARALLDPSSHLAMGEKLKADGLDAVEANNEGWMHRARLQARLIYRDTRGVCSDDLRRWADRTGDQPNSPNAWGAVFRKGFRCIGRCKSTYGSNHGREIKVWAPEGTGWNSGV